MNPSQAIPHINALSAEAIPFLLLADFELQKIKVIPLSELTSGILYDINGVTNHKLYDKTSPAIDLKVEAHPFDKYYHEFDAVLDELLFGNTFLINLTSKNKVKTTAELIDIFGLAQAKYKLHVNIDGGNFVVFSPETFVKINNGVISTYPMKGTIDASIPGAKDLLINDQKELAEHYTIVDLLRNDLSINAKKVEVTRFRYLDLIKSNNKNLYQASSEIKGQLPEDYKNRLGDIIFSMLPAGSISGAPKKKTVEIIQTTEPQPRGYYTGICGLFDGENFDSFVMIRYLEKIQNQLFYRSGGGITFQSQVEEEYQEMIDKIYIPLG